MTDNEPKPTPQPKAGPAPAKPDAISPDELMSDFRGHSLIKIVLFTVVAHVFILALFSPGYLKTQLFGESQAPDEEVAELSDEEKLEKAQKDGNAALREVADKYGLTIKQLREQLDAEQAAAPATGAQPASTGTTDAPEQPGSQIERDLEVEVEGPKVPDLSVDEEEDLFAPDTP